jgi:hypothetical protein
LPSDRKDEAMCEVGIIDYSVGGAYWEGSGSGGRERQRRGR